ncbi:MAG: UDP-N-acetylmuramate dehydrogenase [Nitrospirae bacterium]|nr:UDP-N-acetylmuramate dehydrogenase [Nitrospirota bacterium]
MPLETSAQEAMSRLLGDRIEFRVPMARYTTLRVGGPVEAFASPRSIDEVRALLDLARVHRIPYVVKGRGSNLLVLSGGLEGLVVDLTQGLLGLRRLEGNRVCAESGVAIMTLLNFCAKEGLAGMEFLTGTPGSVGGAVFMNAGAHGGEVKDVLEEIELVNGTGRVEKRARAQIEFRYRRSGLAAGTVVLAATFALRPGDPAEVREAIRTLVERRRKREPKGTPSAGSIFKNPTGDFAGRLIEAAGLKGARVGGAVVSPDHANFIVNESGASGDDVLALIRLVRTEVNKQFGVLLEPEVQIVGRPERPELAAFMEELNSGKPS